MHDTSYSVDDILLEYAHPKKEEPESSPPTPRESAREEDTAGPTTEAWETDNLKTRPIPSAELSARPAPPATAKNGPAPLAADVSLRDASDLPPVTRTLTRVLSAPDDEEEQSTHEIPFGQMPGQMVFEAYANPDKEAEQRLRAARSAKVRDFRIIRGGLRLTGTEEEESEPEEEPVQPLPLAEDGEIEDYSEGEDPDAVRSELSYRRKTDAAGAVASTVIAAVLLGMAILSSFGVLGVTGALLLSLQLALLVGMTAINHRQVLVGLKGCVTFHANSDSPAALLSLFSMLYLVFGYFREEAVCASLPFSAVAGCALCAQAIARALRSARISRNFSFLCAKNGTRTAAKFLDNKTLSRLSPGDAADGADVVYFEKTRFLSGFLSQSYASDAGDRTCRWFVPVCLFAALLCGAGCALLHRETAWVQAPQVFVQTLCLSLPAWILCGVQSPMTRLCRRLLRAGGMLCGWQAVERFGDHPDALIVDAGELFPAGRVKLHGIRTFSGARIDEAITDAAAVVLSGGGPLAPVFRKVVENINILTPAEEVTYEQDMGLSGWVGGKRVLVGTRQMLDNHGVTVPPKSEEERFTKDGRLPVYLSTGGELCAMLVVSYSADPAVANALSALRREKVELMVRSCDPAVNAPLLASLFSLSPGDFRVLSAEQGRELGPALREETSSSPALLSAGARGSGRILGVSVCCRLRRAAKAGIAVGIASGSVGLAFSLFIGATAGTLLSAPVLCGFALGGAALTWLLSHL